MKQMIWNVVRAISWKSIKLVCYQLNNLIIKYMYFDNMKGRRTSVTCLAFILAAIVPTLIECICPDGEYWNPLNNACTTQCPWNYPHLYFADPSTNECVITCPSTPSLYANHETQQCVSTCPWEGGDTTNQTYYDNVYRTCTLECPANPSRYKSYSTTTRTCIQYCESGSYALDSTRACTNTCPNFYFINSTLTQVERRCVSVCPNSTFVDQSNSHCVKSTSCPALRYGDPITGLCVQHCSSVNGVQMFIDDNPSRKMCVYVCPDGYYKQNEPNAWKCVTSCLASRWIDYVTMSCVATCPSGSYSYSNGSCVTSCPGSLYADPFTHNCHTSCSNSYFSDPTTHTCVEVCPYGYFGDITGGYVCRQTCSIATEFGNPLSRLCVTKGNCPTPYVYADNFTRKCVTQCPESQNYYGDPVNNQCVLTCPWDSGTSHYTYKDPSTRTCVTTCPLNPSYYRYNSTFSCVASCPSPFFAVESSRMCELVCPDGFFEDSVNRRCVATCPQDPNPQFYFMNTTSNSDQCLQVCPLATLADPTTMTCITTTCPTNPSLFAFNNTCIPTCPENMFQNTDSRTCQNSCTGVWNEDSSTRRCVLVCPTNPELYAYNNECIAECPADWYSDNSTRKCVQTCNSTWGYIAYEPLKMCVSVCINNTFEHEGYCIETCPNSTTPFYYKDRISMSCVTACPDYYFKDHLLGECVLVDGCSYGYFADHTIRECVEECNSSVYVYKDDTSMQCVDQCPYGMYGDYSNMSAKVCSLLCPDGWFEDNSTWTCVDICPTIPSYYADTHLKKCVSKCREEVNQFAQDAGRICVTECDVGEFADIYTRRCLPECMMIPSTYEFVDGTERLCVLECPIGQFADNSTRRCVEDCPDAPNYFRHWESKTCVAVCPETETTKFYADVYTRTCVEECPTADNDTYSDPIIRVCVQVCSGPQFSDNSTGQCVEECPSDPDYFGKLTNKECVFFCRDPADSVELFADNETRTCVQECPEGSFADDSTYRCVGVCPVDELYYGDPSTHICVEKCPTFPPLFADNMTQTCVHVCPNETYGTPDTRICEAATNCTDLHFADPFSKMCVTDCPPTQSTYANNDTQKCEEECPEGLFADNSTWRCVDVCPSSPSYFGYERRCVESCPDGYYADNWTRLCLESFDCNNETFGDPTSETCVTECPFNFYADVRLESLLCVQVCPEEWYADDLTKKCVEKCPQSQKTYGSNQTNKCVQVCPEDEFAQNETRMCISSCPDGSFADSNVRVCVAECSATPNLYAEDVGNTCVDICPEEHDYYADDSTRLCVPECPQSESTFADRLTRRCVLKCPESSFTYADVKTRTCEEECTYNGTYKSYADNSTLTCVERCPSNPDYYADDESRSCVAVCPNNTVPRTFADNSTRICQPLCNLSFYYYSDNTTGDCLTVCPGGYFADDYSHFCVPLCPGLNQTENTTDSYGFEGDRTCKTECDDGWFAQNSTRLCMSFCPIDEYADSAKKRCVEFCDGQLTEYADNTTNKCVRVCPEVPDMFADKDTYTCVESCPLDFWASNMTRECVEECYPMYADNYTRRCVWNCPEHLMTYADNETYRCVEVCPSELEATIGTYADDSTKTCVRLCPENPWTYAENETRTCVFRCPNDSFGENNTRQCVESCEDWQTYADNSTTFCVEDCPANSFADNSTFRCVETCPPGTFADNSTWKCVTVCPSNPALYGDITTRICVINCANSSYGDDLSRTCTLECPDDPMYFAYEPTKRCYKDCLYPYFGEVALGECVLSCFWGEYKNMTTHRCELCPIYCTSCIAELQCQTCVQNVELYTGQRTNYYLYNGSCLTGCVSGTEADCKSACPSNYLTGLITYASDTSLSCVQTCPTTPPRYGLNATRKCVVACPVGYYPSEATRRCQSCINGCNNCSNSTYCFGCHEDRYIYSDHTCIAKCDIDLPYFYGTTCLSSCIAGTYLLNDDVTCADCDTKCATCTGSPSNCTKCVGAFLYNFNCVTKCPNNFYANSNLQCLPCTATTPECTVEPLTYTLTAVTEGTQLYGILQFNRDAFMDLARIRQIIDLKIPGMPANSYTWDVERITGSKYRINIHTSRSLNELSLQLTFLDPGLVIDSEGTIMESTTTEAPLPEYDYISEDVVNQTKSISAFSGVLSYIALAILLVLMFKGSYPLLFVFEVFQTIYFHYFVIEDLPYNYSSFLVNLKFLNFQFLPSMFNLLIPKDFSSPATPFKFKEAIQDTTFFISAGHYFIVIVFYMFWSLAVGILKHKKINRWRKLRKICQSTWLNRIKYGAINECMWFCFMTFMLFGLWQFYDTEIYGKWTYANFALAILSILGCFAVAIWNIHLTLSYRNDFEEVPKKFEFIKGDESFLPYQMPLRYIRKLLLCFFLFSAMMELQIMGMIAANFLILAFYFIYKPSKSSFTNYINVLIEISYIALEVSIFLFINDIDAVTSKKMVYGKAMIAFSAIAILAVTIWMVWQFLLFLYDFKCIRDLVANPEKANRVHPGEDNLKIQLDREYRNDEMISHISGLSGEDNNEEHQEEEEDDTVIGIEKQYERVINFDEKTQKLNIPQTGKNKKNKVDTFSEDQSNQNEPRLISSRASSRMLFADINIEEFDED